MTTTVLSLRQAFAGRHVLVAGASGFLGKVWLSMALHRLPDIGKIYVLMRRQRGQSARERFQEIADHSPAFKPLHDEHGARLGAFLADKVEVVEGDLTAERLGLAPDVLARLRDRLDLIVQIAALVEFAPDLRRAVDTNITGSLRMMELARSCGHAAFLDVSTSYVAGARDGLIPEQAEPNYCPNGEAFDPEAEYQDLLRVLARGDLSTSESVSECKRRALRWGWSNGYQYTKSLAESLLIPRAGQVPYAIVRPSIIECALEFPFAGWNEGYNCTAPVAYLSSKYLRHLPVTPHYLVDTVPVDQVVKGMLTVGAALLERRHMPVYHLATSDRNPATRGRWLELMSLGNREHQRQGDTSLERLMSIWDAVPARPGTFFSTDRLQAALGTLGQVTRTLRRNTPRGLADRLAPFDRKLDDARSLLDKATEVLDLLAPFLQDGNCVFECRAIEQHDVAERELRFDPRSIDWRDYVLHVQMPGLRKWCFPVFEGRPVERLEPERPVRAPRAAAPAARPAAARTMTANLAARSA